MFSGKPEDWPAFQEQFEARMIVNKLADCLHGRITTPEQLEEESTTQQNARQREERELQRLQQMVWVELVQCLD